MAQGRARAGSLWAVAAVAAAIGSGCGDGSERATGGAAAADPGPVAGGTLVIGIKADPDSLNPYLARQSESLLIASRVLPRLWREVLPGDAEPAGLKPELVAGEPRFEDGGRTVRFALRGDAVWSDGSPVTCEDVRFTWQAQVDPALGWRAASIKRHISAIECADPLTVVARFDRAYPEMLIDLNDLHLLSRSLGEVPRDTWRQVDWAARLPAAGPYRIERVAAGQEIVLARNPSFRGAPGLPRIDRIVFRVVPDTTARLTQLLAGDLDLVDGVPPGNAALAAPGSGVALVKRPGWGYTYVGWMDLDPAAYRSYREEREAGCRAAKQDGCPDDAAAVARLAAERPHPLFGDPRVRQAMTLAIDRQALVDTLLAGQGEVLPSPILAPLPEHDPSLAAPPRDPARARALLAEAGFADRDGDGTLDKGGKPFVFELVVQAGNALRRDVAVMVQRDLSALGVAVTVRPVEDSAFFAVLGARGADAWIGNWRVPGRVDMVDLLHAEAAGTGGLNFGAWSEPEADRLALAARDEADRTRRAGLWREWERIFVAEQPYTLLFREARLTAVRERVRGEETLLANDALNAVETWWLASP
ncbi:MAG: extracellular solute-binding protein family 5 [Acidobacteria bacterium]|nr:extracellular solute-binding protein family 5 [Acidobacteriota bacterium]